MQPLHHLVNSLLAAGYQGFDAAVAPVFYPARNTKFLCLELGVVTKTHPLDDAGYSRTNSFLGHGKIESSQRVSAPSGLAIDYRAAFAEIIAAQRRYFFMQTGIVFDHLKGCRNAWVIAEPIGTD
jgi:hypothetical protein